MNVGWGVIVGVLSLAGQAAPAPTPRPTPKEGPAYMAPQAPIHVVTPAELGVYGAFLQQVWAKISDDGPLARQTVLLENDALDSYQPNRRAWESYLLKRLG